MINNPNDGSLFAYSENKLKAYNRALTGYGSASETAESALLRTSMDSYANNAEVVRAVEQICAHYVLQLDCNSGEDPGALLFGSPPSSMWTGIDGITQDTPGFKLILEDGDMRLFEIVPIEDIDDDENIENIDNIGVH